MKNRQEDKTGQVVAAIASATDKPFSTAFKAMLGVRLADLAALGIVLGSLASLVLVGILAVKLLG